MKYILTAAIVTLALTACTDKKPETQTSASENSSITQTTSDTAANTPVDHLSDAVKTINFAGPEGMTVELKTMDNFDTAQLTDNSGKIHELKRVMSGSGIKLANEDGVSIHFKDFNGVNDGTLQLVKGKDIDIKESKIN